MARFNTKKVLDLLIKLLLTVIVFFIPLWFAFFLRAWNVFELNKIIVFKILILLVFLLFLIIVIFYKKEFGRVLTLLSQKYLIIPLVFLFSLVLSSIFSINPELSFFGYYDRQEGVISHIFYFLFFILLLVNVKDKSQIKVIVRAAVLSSIVVSVYGLAQAFGLDLFSWSESTTLRITSTFGQPNNLGSYLLLALPLSIYLFFSSKKFLFKAISFLSLVIGLLTLYYTFSLSTWLGLSGGVIITFLVWLIVVYKNRRLNNKTDNKLFKKSKKVFFLILFIFFLIIFVIINFSNLKTFKKRINNLVNLQSGSTASRLQFWQAAWQGIKARPFLGYGPETQDQVLAKYYEKDWAIYSNVNVRPNRAHNIFLDILLTGGLFGLSVYLALLYLFYKLIWRNIKLNQERLLNFCILLSLASYLIYLQFNFPHVTTQIYFWLFLAVLVLVNSSYGCREVLAANGVNKIKKENKIGLNRQESAFLKPSGQKIYLTVLLLVVAGGVLWQISQETKKVIADHYFYKMQEACYVHEDFFEAFILYEYLTDLKIKDDYYKKQYALMLVDWIPRLDKYGSVFRRQGELILKDILPGISHDSNSDYYIFGNIYAFLANEENNDFYDLAQENFKKAIRASMEKPKNYRALAQLYFKQKNYDQAIKYYQIALSKLPELDHPYLNKEHKEAIEYEARLNNLRIEEARVKKDDIIKK